MKYDLTTGSVSMTMLKFSLPMILGNLMQQLYNISDTLIVGHFIGTDALAAEGDDEQEAIKALSELVNNRFGEHQ